MGINVLIVEDSESDLKRLSDAYNSVASGLGISNIDVALGVDHAISMIDLYASRLGRKPDIVITDYDMPGTGDLAKKDGYEDNGNGVARYAKGKLPDVKVIGHTGGDPSRFDSRFVIAAVPKIIDGIILANLVRTAVRGLSK